MGDRTLNYRVLTYNQGSTFEEIETVVEEKKYNVIVNDEVEFDLTCSPFNVKELVVGNMWMRNFLDSKEDILAISIVQDLIKVSLSKKIKRAKREYKIVDCDITLPLDRVTGLMEKLQKRANLFSKTGGVHSAGLSDGSEIIVYMEDIGRHNTVDKLMGYCILNDISVHDKIMVFSGRIPFEIINKLSMMGIPIFISKSAPTSLGIEMAEKYNITICGFTRGERYHVYSCRDRLV
ncbi:MAG: formate dehydrogenase accessory sulfurtransferase FdhD [Lagierella massiliensis]|nr:formate dehydrogenase accessory sulfurtransferase FdhD [Lagierella massiliensis]